MGRIARVYPVYALSLFVVAPFILEDRTSSKAPLVAAHGLLLQGWIAHLPVSWNTPAWSLSCEMFFYLAFPLATACIQRATWFNTLALAAFARCLTRLMWRLGVPDEIKPLIQLADFLMGIAAACFYGLLKRAGRLTSADTGREVSPRGAWFYLPGFALGAALIAFPSSLAAIRGS